MTRRDRIIRLAKLRGDRAALAIMGERDERLQRFIDTRPLAIRYPVWTESELRALWGDR